MARRKELSVAERVVLRNLRSSKSRRWHPQSAAWVWDKPSGTVRILESLVKRGLVGKRSDGAYVPAEDIPEVV